MAQAGVGYDLVFYDDQVSYAGHIQSLPALQTAINQNGPRGTTYVTEALRGAIQKYQTRRGLYVIVITDGEFADKDEVRQLVLKEMLPQITPDNPYAFRLHFVGAGEGVDHAFLRQIEADASGQGIPLVTQHHHAHLSHSHASILDELDRAFLGVGTEARFGELGAAGRAAGGCGRHGPGITHTTGERDAPDVGRRGGGLGLPAAPRPARLRVRPGPSRRAAVAVQFQAPDRRLHQIVVPVPLPRQASRPADSGSVAQARLPPALVPPLARGRGGAGRSGPAAGGDGAARAGIRQAEQPAAGTRPAALGQGGIPSGAPPG